MKRRLSAAISFVGDPLVVFLDEPSTGLDPASRRSLWDVVRSNKTGRGVLLTTHSMEEAQVGLVASVCQFKRKVPDSWRLWQVCERQSLGQSQMVTADHRQSVQCSVHLASKRSLWDVVRSNKAGRGVLLTTHSMDSGRHRLGGQVTLLCCLLACFECFYFVQVGAFYRFAGRVCEGC
jgi:hypothetical protein